MTGEQPASVLEVPVRRSRARRIAVRAGKVVLVALAGYYVLCLLLLVVYRFADPPITGVQLQRHVEARVAGNTYQMKRNFVGYGQLPRHVPRAVISAEDGRFWSHSGFDFKELRAAGAELLEGERPRGASTITHQLMKNLFGTTSRNVLRKLFDWALTPPAQLILGRERILELYLNTAEWGPGVFGIDAGARHHYGVAARNLSRTQAAGLAALLPNPHRRTPATTSQYRGEILRRMGTRGW
jgi:monofunctional glycosyltransferase